MAEKLKLWYMVPSLGYGGTTRIAAALVKYAKHFDVEIVVLKRTSSDKTMPENINYYPLAENVPFWVQSRLLKTVFYFRQINKSLRENVPSIVLGDVTALNTILLLNRVLYGEPKRLIVRMGNIKSKSLRAEKSIRAIVERLSIKYLFPKATAIITPTKAVRDDLIANFRIPEERIFVIPNPLDIEAIQEAASEPVNHPWFSDSIPVITTVGRLSPRKGIEYLIEAIRILILHKKEKCRLLIVGNGPRRVELQAKVEKEKLTDYITFLGEQPNPFKFVAKSSLYIHPALWEGFGYAVVEAMACGIPVIAMKDSGGPEEIINDGVDGFLIPPADPGVMAEAILRLLNDETLRNRIAIQAKERAQQFDARRIVPTYEKVLQEHIVK